MSGTVAELLARCRDAGLSLLVEGDALCVDYERGLPLDLIEEIRLHKPEVMAVLTAPAAPVIAPARWAGMAADGPSFEEPCPERSGLIERRGAVFLHFCIECGRWGAYSYGASLGQDGRWYCRLHRPDEERSARARHQRPMPGIANDVRTCIWEHDVP
jgi:hypothetical protein